MDTVKNRYQIYQYYIPKEHRISQYKDIDIVLKVQMLSLECYTSLLSILIVDFSCSIDIVMAGQTMALLKAYEEYVTFQSPKTEVIFFF